MQEHNYAPTVTADDPQIPVCDTYQSVDLQDPTFLDAEIRKLWDIHKQYECGFKSERTKMLHVGNSLGELLHAAKALLATVGRSGRWSAYLRQLGINRCSADRLVARFAEAKGLTEKPPHRAVSEPSDTEISKLAHRVLQRVESKLPSARSRYDLIRCLTYLFELEYQYENAGLLVRDRYHTERGAVISAPEASPTPEFKSEVL
jgi:hypothetical protein